MTREEAIKILTSEIYSDEIAECGVKFNVALGVAIKALEQEPKTEWIPVSERLPKKEDDYLVTDIDKEMHKVRFYFPLDGREPYFSGSYKIVAWMPLPKPYRVENEDNE